jgi:hypothetical protein
MSDPKNIDWNEVVEDAQRLDMLRLQREQTDLLRGMSSGGNSATTPNALEKKLGVMRSQNPVEYDRRYSEWKKNDLRKTIKFMVIFFGSLGFVLLVAMLFADWS